MGAFDEIFNYENTIRSHIPKIEGSPLYLNLRAAGPIRTNGGCGGNVSYTLGLMGATVRLHSWIGKDGEGYLSHLNKSGVDTSDVIIASDLYTPTGVLLADSIGDQILFFGEPLSPPELYWPDTSFIDLCIITAGTPSLTVRSCRAAHKTGLPIVIDPGKFIMDITGEELLECLKGADSIVFNKYESNLIQDRLKISSEKLLSLAETLVVTEGVDGMTVFTKGTSRKLHSVPLEKIIDPNGAGDAFLAGYSYGRMREYPVEVCACFGATAASFSIETHGAQSHSFTMEEFRERYRQYYGNTGLN